jgi:long-subunit fatty acid transport protein
MRIACTVGTAGLAVILVCAAGAPALAQTNDEVFPQLTWNFATPGARANAMGRAFIGLADDATASVTNPAGLVQLTRPQFYLEVKNTDLRVKRLAASDSLHTRTASEFGSNISSVPFLAISAPVGSRMNLSFTRYEYLRHDEDFDLEPRPIPDVPFTFFGVEASSRFRGVTYAGSVGFSVSPKLQVGVSVTFDQLSADSTANRFTTVAGPGGQFDLSRSGTIVNRTRIDASDSTVGAVVGALYRLNQKVAIGVSYTRGPRFEIEQTLEINTSGPANTTFITGTNFPKPVSVHVPDRVGAGVSLRPSSRLLVVFDATRVAYSSLADDFTVIFNTGVLTGDEFSVDDVVEVHAGGEYLLLSGRQPLFIRAGVFTNPDHRTRFGGTPDPTVNASENAKYNLLARKTQVGGTVGLGITLGSRGQVDIAYVSTGEFVASIGVRFGS